MYPVLIKIGGISITSFGVMIALGFLAAGWVTARELRRRGENGEHAWDLAGYGAIAGILGAKLYYMLLHWNETSADFGGALVSRSGLVWYGGLIGGVLAVLWRLRRLKLPVLKFGDAIAPGMAIGYAVGRVGCFLVGDDWGRPTTLPWGVRFPQGAPPSTAANVRAFGVDVPRSVPANEVLAVHPTQLYETGISLVIFAVLWKLRHRFRTTGTLWFTWVALAGVERFVVEIFRAKDDRFFGAISIAQLISLAMIVIGVATASYLHRRAAAGQGTRVAGKVATA
jgi:phosphatidylglycerol:prolipoprotein diacylglycerol transferase